jgi:multisubunit Na+/H+ antiporter MnhB subunit
MQTVQPNLIGMLIAAVIVVLMLSFRMRRMKRSRPLSWKRLWIAPALLTAIAAITLARVALTWLDWAWLGLALLIGAALGWQRGRLMSIAMDPTSQTLTTQATPMAIYFLLGLIVLRLTLRVGLGLELQGEGPGPAFVNSLFVIFAAGLFMAQGLEMAIRARRLLDTASAEAGLGRENGGKP